MENKKVKSAKFVLTEQFTDELEHNEITYAEYSRRIYMLSELEKGHDLKWYSKKLGLISE